MDHTSQQGPVSRAIEVWRTKGAKDFARRVAARLGSLVFKSNSAIWYVRVLSPPRPGGTAPGSFVHPLGGTAPGSFVPVEPQELAQWLRRTDNLAWAADPREMEVAGACDHRWASWTVGGDIVAFCKVGGRRVFIVDFEMALRLPDGLAYLSDVYVLPGMRRRGIGRELLARTLESLGRSSFSGVVCHIPESNEPSAALFRSLGFEELGRVRFTRILGIPAFSAAPEKLLEKASLTCGRSMNMSSSAAR